MKFFIFLVLSLLLNQSCKEDDNPVKPTNHNPEILSLKVFPNMVIPSDSLIVICEAMDPDGDTLVYDWITTGVVRIKGAFQDDHFLYHTTENTRIFYAPDSLHVLTPIDTFWIQCITRDVRGGSAGGIVKFIVNKI